MNSSRCSSKIKLCVIIDECFVRSQNCFPFWSTWFNPRFLVRFVLLIFLVFYIVHSWLSILDCPFLIVHSRLSILDCPFSIAHSRLSILDCPFSIAHSRLSILDCPFSIVHSRLSILDCPFSIVHSRLSILDCPFSILYSWLSIRFSLTFIMTYMPTCQSYLLLLVFHIERNFANYGLNKMQVIIELQFPTTLHYVKMCQRCYTARRIRRCNHNDIPIGTTMRQNLFDQM
jgi:hypothetical protein